MSVACLNMVPMNESYKVFNPNLWMNCLQMKVHVPVGI